MMYLLIFTFTFFCTALLLVGSTHSATLALPTGDVIYLRASAVKTFNETQTHCRNMKGDLVFFASDAAWEELSEFLKANLPTSGNTDVWTSAAKIKGKEGYFWYGNHTRPVDEKLVPIQKSSCNSDCCNVKLSVSRKLLIPVKCDEPERARQLCFNYPMTNLMESIELQESTRIKLSKEVDKLSASYSSQKSEIHSVSKAKSSLYVLFSLTLVAVIALGIFMFIIWRKIN